MLWCIELEHKLGPMLIIELKAKVLFYFISIFIWWCPCSNLTEFKAQKHPLEKNSLQPLFETLCVNCCFFKTSPSMNRAEWNGQNFMFMPDILISIWYDYELEFSGNHLINTSLTSSKPDLLELNILCWRLSVCVLKMRFFFSFWWIYFFFF